MSTDLTGIQTVALHGLFEDQGMSAPDITALWATYETKGGVLARKSVVASAITASSTIATFSGFDPTSGGSGTANWSSVATYTAGQYVRYGNLMYLCILTNSNKNPQTGVSFWTPQNITPYTVFSPSYSITIPSWFETGVYTVKLNGVTQTLGSDFAFTAGYSAITFTTPLLSTDSVVISVLPREIFYRLCEEFPAAIGVVPQAFNSNLGNGMLIDLTYPRTAALFPSVGVRKFAKMLAQAQAWSAESASVVTSAAQSSFGSAGNPAAGATGGFSKLAGNSETNFKTVGAAFKKSGDLINVQKPWLSFSALGILNTLYQESSLWVGNLLVKVIGKTFLDPSTNQSVVISNSWIQTTLAASSADSPLRDTVTDQALAQFISQQLDSGDVNAIKNALSSTVDAKVFTDLVDYTKIWGDPQLSSSASGTVLTTTGYNSLVTAFINVFASDFKFQPETKSSQLGESLLALQAVTGSELNALTKPTTQDQYNSLLDHYGKGSGKNGVITCSDALGATNYKTVLQQTIDALSLLSSSQLAKINTDMSAVWYASCGYSDPPNNTVPATVSTVVLSDGSSGYADWTALMLKVKTLSNQACNYLVTQLVNTGKDNLLSPYNALAETHNTSVHIYATAPFVSSTGDKSSVVNFVTQLPSLGKNSTEFTAQDFIENCCEDNVTGQAIIGAMREAKNAELLAQSAIGTDANSSSESPLPVSESAPGLVGGGIWPAPVDPFASKPSSSTGF